MSSTAGSEQVVTYLLATVVVTVAANPRVPGGVTAMAIGFALAAAILMAGPLTGADVNPARAIGPIIMAGKFTDWWSYLAGPLLGGAAAVWWHGRVVRPVQLPAGTGQSTAVGNFGPRTGSAAEPEPQGLQPIGLPSPNRSEATARAAGRRGHGRPVRPG